MSLHFLGQEFQNILALCSIIMSAQDLFSGTVQYYHAQKVFFDQVQVFLHFRFNLLKAAFMNSLQPSLLSRKIK